MIVIFDLDETITRFDTTLPYLIGWSAFRPRCWLQLPFLCADVLLYKTNKIPNNELKTRFFTRLMAGANVDQEARWTQRFNSFMIKRGIYKDAVDTLEQHRKAGDRIVLVSASVDVYVKDIGEKLGFAEVVCTEMQRLDGALTGAMAGENCYGAGKLRAVEAYLGTAFLAESIVCYSDSRTDLPLFEKVDRAVVINPGRKLKALAASKGFDTEFWR